VISEPMTAATDYVLALVTLILAGRLLRAAGAERARRAWGIAFVALALGAALGGTFHAFAVQALWKPTLFVIGLAAAAMLAGSAFATTLGRWRAALLVLAAAKLALFWAWIMHDDRFIGVVADTGSAFVLVALLHLLRRADPGAGAILAGVALSALGAAAQASGFDLHRHFNHNDVYHLIQLGAMFAYYRGARRLADRR
jgi:uncharacterized protein DUF6962